MSKSKTKASPPPAPLKGTNLKLPLPVVECLARLKATYGMSNTFAVIRGVLALEQTLAEQNRLK